MILLEQLYRLLAADDQTRPLDPIFNDFGIIAASASIENTFTCPERHAALITNILIECIPGAGQNVARFTHIRVQRGDATQLVRVKSLDVAAAANAAVVLDWQGEAILQPGGQIRGVANFNAGAVANQSNMYVHGMLIPLGTIQRT